MRNILFYLFILLALAPRVICAEDYDFTIQRKISQINFKGLEILDPNYVRSVIKSKVGSNLIARYASEDINTIYQLGIAKNINLDVNILTDSSVELVFQIEEKPRINEILFNGNFSIEDKTFTEKFTSKKFSIVNLESIASDVKKITGQYEQKKYNQVKVYYELIPISNNKVNLQFNIIENPQTYITEINFEGNKFFYSLDLKRRIISHQIDCFSWITQTGILDEARINNDLRVLYQLYLDNGFVRVKVFRPRVKIYNFKTYSKAVINISLEEGAQYYVKNLAVSGLNDQPLIDTNEQFLERMALKKGSLFRQSQFFQDQVDIENFFQDRGYAYAKIDDQVFINDIDKTIDLNYEINKGNKVYINRINIEGNQSTRDFVVRRELAIHDNQLFRVSKIQESRNNLNQLGYFDQQIGVDFIKDENNDRSLDYTLKLKEALTGSINLSLTYSENSGFGIATQVAKRNFLGNGQSISLRFNSDFKADHYLNLTFTQPYILDTKLTSTSTIGYAQYESRDSDNVLNYKVFDYSLIESLGQPIWPNWQLIYRLSLKRIYYRNISTNGFELLNFISEHDERTLGLAINYNTVNHPVFSTDGINFDLGYNFIGAIPGGNLRYDSLNLETQYFQSLTKDNRLVFMARYRFNRLIQVNPNNVIPPGARLALGGITTLRGFDYASVSGADTYVDQNTNFDSAALKKNDYDTYRYYKLHQSGIISSLFNFELLFPLSTDQSNIRGVTFFDAGNVWSEPKMYELTGAKLDYSYYKKSYGLGVRVITPAGVLRFEYANVINPKPRDNNSKFEFYIGSLF